MFEGAVIDVARQRDQPSPPPGPEQQYALTSRPSNDTIVSPWRPAEQRLYRRLRQVNQQQRRWGRGRRTADGVPTRALLPYG